MSVYKLLSANTSASATSSAVQLKSPNGHSVWIATFILRGELDGAQIKPRLSPTGSAGTWLAIGSATLSAIGQVNVEAGDGAWVDAFLSGGSTSTSVDLWIAKGAYFNK